MADAPAITHDDVIEAFDSGSVLTDSDELLLGYLRVLCTAIIHNDPVRLLANNRCITINAILMRRYAERENKTTTRLTWLVIVLAFLNVVGIGWQIYWSATH